MRFLKSVLLQKTIKGALLFSLGTAGAFAQLSSTSYRALGQVDLHLNGVNMVQGVELNNPASVALDPRNGQTHIYIADTRNSRILAWADVASYQTGEPPSLILGQLGPQYAVPQGIGVKGMNSPLGLAVDPVTGNLFVADFGDNRVLRFASPFNNLSRIEPDAVYGQSSFTGRGAGNPSTTSLNSPRAVAVDPLGNLWVADTGSHRVVRYSASSLGSAAPVAADVVIGQKDFFSSNANAGGNISASGFDTPTGLTFDGQGNLYVADGRNNRVLKFAGPFNVGALSPTAVTVWGQANFASRTLPPQPSSSSMNIPFGLAVDNGGSLYVATPADNRVLVFPPATGSVGPVARAVLGQSDFNTVTANTGSVPLASPNSLASPNDIKLDPNGNVFIADTANSRVLGYPVNTKTATQVWGQTDFVSNGVNQVKPASVAYAAKIVIDYSTSPYAIYVSDTANHRVLGWNDSVRFRNGDPADIVIGQPNLRTAVSNVDTQGTPTPSRNSLSFPAGMAINPFDGTLYVADTGNHRVLRFPRPFSQSGRISPDAVYGQVDFTSAASAAVTGSTLNSPVAVAFANSGNLFISDNGNNRVLEFASGAGTGASAIRVYGQPSMTSSVRPSRPSPQTLTGPQGIAVDGASNLYVVDTGSHRVLIFPNTQSAPPTGMTASFVIGQSAFGNNSAGGGAAGLRAPSDVAVDSNGSIYVSDTGNNRALIYPSLIFLQLAGAPATSAVGQPNLTSTAANWDSTDGLATNDALFTPVGMYIDRQDTLYVGDTGNSRVVQFLKAAAVVNAATFNGSVPVGQGALATLFGAGLAPNKNTVSTTPWPRTLSNRQLVINDDLAAPLYYLDAGQANFQVPTNAPVGADRIAVRVADTGEFVAGGSLLVASASPGIFTANQSGSGQAAVLNQDGTVNGTGNPAAAGSTISIFATGQGQVSPSVVDGTPAPGPPGLANTVAVPTTSASTCQNTQPSMCVIFGTNTFGNVTYSGLAPGFIGLWQINVVVPAVTTAGNFQLRVITNGTPSNTVSVAVR